MARRDDGHVRRARATAARILDVAAVTFIRDGYRSVTVEAIAAGAGVAPSSVYNHFGSKPGIAQALAERALSVHDTYIGPVWNLETPPLERLIAAAGATLVFSRQHPALFQAMALSYLGPLGLFDPDTAAAKAIAARRRLQTERIAAALQEAVSAGQARAHDSDAMAHFLVASWAGVLSMAAGPPETVNAAVVLETGIRGLIEGLATETATHDSGLHIRFEEALNVHGLGGRVPRAQR